MWLTLHQVEYLTISEEKHENLLKHVLEDEIFVVVTHLHDIRLNEIIDSELPFVVLVVKLTNVVNLFLGDVTVQNLFVNSASQGRWNTPFGVLDQERLIVLLEKSFTNYYPLIQEGPFIVNTYLSKSHVKLTKLLPELIKVLRVEL
jgi:hypothetical protein